MNDQRANTAVATEPAQEVPAEAVLAPADTPQPRRRGLGSRLLLVEALVLLALAQVLFAGYRLGVGNQTIQIPFVQHYINPTLYAADPAIQTARDYPSYFFRGLARLAVHLDIPTLYLILHAVTTLGALAAAYAMAKTIANRHAAGLVMVLILLAGHHRALGGDEMYSIGFTHTWAVFPLAIVAILLLYRGWALAAFALAGVIFNLHALVGAYLAAMFGFWAICDVRRLGWFKLSLLMAAFVIPAGPTLWLMAQHRQSFDADWIRLTKLRSADHSFPSSWWQAGLPDVPRFLLLCGMGALSLGFATPNRNHQRTGLLLAAATGILFLLGLVFSEFLPFSGIVRAQLFRSSRLLLVVVFAHSAFGIVSAWEMARTARRWRRIAGGVEMFAAAGALLTLAVPPLLAYLPHAFVLLLVASLLSGRLSWAVACFGSAVMLVTIVAWNRIEFPVAGLGTLVRAASAVATGHGKGWDWSQNLATGAALRDGASAAGQGIWSLSVPFCIALVGGLGIWVVSRLRAGRLLRWVTVAEGLAACAILGVFMARPLLGSQARSDRWSDVQRWAAANTPADAVFLTPPQLSGFRIESQRAIVGEWRDGTQMYFTGNFAGQWWPRMQALRPDMLADGRGQRLLLPGKDLKELDDDALIGLAGRFGAKYIVLNAGAERNLEQVYSNGTYSVYIPRGIVPPKEVVSKDLWLAQRKFMQEVVQPNIERYRKSDGRVEVVDASGRAMSGLAIEVRQTRQAFGFGCSLPFFAPVEGEIRGDYKPPPVTQKELDRFLEVFNYTTIPFSGKWGYVEYREGQRNYAELDKYIDWCAKHDIQIEFHYLSGLLPEWFRSKPRDVQAELFFNHSMDLVKRYGDRVKIWQVVNDAYLLDFSKPVFEAVRKMHPEATLGISNCTYWCVIDPEHSERIYTGLSDLKRLQALGVKPDYYAPHGHAPFGVWPDAQEMYERIDQFAAEGVRVRITEAMVPLRSIVGPIRKGAWTPELQAEFLAQFLAVCYSHPAVDSVNYWALGPDCNPDEPGSGLLDDKYDPKPAFNALKKLIKEDWMTRLSGALDDDGQFRFRGFHGDYEVRVTLESGKVVSGALSISPKAPNRWRLQLDPSAQTLRQVGQ